MGFLVLDASVIFDLKRGGLLEAAFNLEDVLITPDLLFQKELEEEGGPYLRELGLQVVELDPQEALAAQALARSKPRLSSADCWAAICARRDDHRLLTGDAFLRAYAEDQGLDCSGILWLLDRMHNSGVATPMSLFEGLTRISQHPRCRLPRDEIEKRLKKWKG